MKRLVKDFTEEDENHKNEFNDLKSTVMKIEGHLTSLETSLETAVQEFQEILVEAIKRKGENHRSTLITLSYVTITVYV